MNNTTRILDGETDFSWSVCGLNTGKMKIAFVDDNLYQKFTVQPTGEYNSAICAYPYTGPLSIQNNKNFCEDGYEPSIWTNPQLKDMALGSYVNRHQTMIDTSITDPGKPVWCVKRVIRNADSSWPAK